MRDSLRGLRAHMRSGLGADLRPERENWKAESTPESSDFRLKWANMRPHEAYFRSERAEYKFGRADLGT